MALDNPAFIKAVGFTLREEGALSTDPADAGNWTGGAVNEGTLVGTKYGISAARYPSADIAGLKRVEAVQFYYRDYWLVANCEQLPARTAMLVFDAAVQHSPAEAIKLLQATVGVMVDGVCGPATIAAVRVKDQALTVVEYLGHRAKFYAKLSPEKVEHFGLGWFTRLFDLQASL